MSQFKYICVTDCFLENEQGEVLLIHRNKDTKIAPNCYNGIGGKLEEFENPYEAITREIKEETGATKFYNLNLKGALTTKDRFGYWQIFIFTGKLNKEDVEITTNREGKLEWVPKESIKDKKLVPDLFSWIDLLWQDQNFFFVKIEYDNDYNLKKKVSVKIHKMSKPINEYYKGPDQSGVWSVY